MSADSGTPVSQLLSMSNMSSDSRTTVPAPQRIITIRSLLKLVFVPASSLLFIASAAFTTLYALGLYPHGIRGCRSSRRWL